ncbi:hypothetical protein PC129_g20292 [Phytophthora cactorum]|uniref:Uncharacterized protein n=1 Tax=Phytophthora cactorum TaxID=29920 RepID=A0A329RH48_9STRA|nr:hypothetical protein Pcac1_g11518 [Phytophthora cactorum]KAG2798759.1 hypothetical protein PC112_g21213 [Phytophthora cactorum]KAG2877983.1 hypothetical protein PC114_g23355 [Phytophthora cactorum]KAG2885701.1 hypothetical protein PC115_g20922 [Phytophthora cactorum]KAG2895286.1 hypothetical protein PC117_g23281 [Phytophthora cactorum]
MTKANDETRRDDRWGGRRDDRLDGRRDDRRDDGRCHKEKRRDRRVTVADADLEEEGFDRRPSIRYASESEWSDDDQSSGNDSAYASDYKDAGFVSNKGMKTGRRENSARDRNDSSQDRNNSASQPSRPYDRRDQSNR